jgi:arylformamidase
LYRFDKAVDLTQTLENGMPVYPGDPSPSFQPAATIASNGVNLTKMTLGSHTGTHVDAPIHFIPAGIGVDSIPVSSLIGEAIVLDLSSKPVGSGISRGDLQRKLETMNVENTFVLCYTGSSDLWGNPETNSNYTYLTSEAAKYLVERKIRAFGIDFLSVEKFHEKSAPAHKILLGAGVFIIESLSSALKQFSGSRILFLALPLKLKNGDGAPCRAVAVPINN